MARQRLGKRFSPKVRGRFVATFARYGYRLTRHGVKTSVLLMDVRDAVRGDPLCSHVWIVPSKPFDDLELEPGDDVAFNALVREYQKNTPFLNGNGRHETELDWELVHLRNVRVSKRIEGDSE